MNWGFLWFLAYPYVIVAIFVVGATHDRWRDPWPLDKAVALAVIWPIAFIYKFIKTVITGFVKLVKEEA